MAAEPHSPECEWRLARRWWIFVCERFPPHLHLPVIALIAAASGLLGLRVLAAPFRPLRLILASAVAILFFFRLRCFDEIKDYAVDLEVNPTRPLARGLLTVGQVKRMFVGVTVFELLITGALGVAALGAHLIAVAYSYLMYKEFFIGRRLRPHLTTYAVTHTFVSVLMALSVMAQLTGTPVTRFPATLFGFALVNWALFNVFEFARKTFAITEEVSGADSYSRRFGPRGAVLLCLSQVAAAISLLAWLSAPAWPRHLYLALLPVAAGVFYGWKPAKRPAAIYRAACGAYQLLFYALLTWQAEAGLK